MKKISKIALSMLFLFTFALTSCGEEEAKYTLSDEAGGGDAATNIITKGELPSLNLDDATSSADTEKPVIVVKGDYSSVQVTSEYAEIPSVFVRDNFDTNPFLTIKATDPNGERVSFTKDERFLVTALGEYTFYFNSVDAHGNVADEVVQKVNVVDNLAPQIDLRGFQTVSGYTRTLVSLPSILTYDYHECDLSVKIGIQGSALSSYEEIDAYALKFRPATEGVYEAIYTVTEKSEKALSSTVTVLVNVSDLSIINGCEGNGVYAWSFGGEMSVNPKPTLSEDRSVISEGFGSIASTKVVVPGSASQMQYGVDGYGFVTGTSIYSDISYCGTKDISGYERLMIDVYNANEVDCMVRFWVQDASYTSLIGIPQTIAPHSWITLSLNVSDMVAKGMNVESIFSTLITFEGHADGIWTYNIDNFRVE